ncbi:MAG: hypothetical protein E4H02_04320 [Lentisphaerales bacterium]|nr:MAG: hypothetical protein E4H02_04320 [Lentisphaerales bacterium]
MKISIASYAFHGLLSEGKMDVFNYSKACAIVTSFSPRTYGTACCRHWKTLSFAKSARQWMRKN